MPFQDLLQKQRDYFRSGQTRPLAFRRDCLRRLRQGLIDQIGRASCRERV